jgi:DNA-binding transcriptional MerR regulator
MGVDRMRIGELASRTSVSTRLLRYYEEQGLLTPCRGSNGYRTYDEEAVTRVRQIRALLSAGLSTGVIATVLPCVRGTTPEFESCPDLRRTLRRELRGIDDRIACLQSTRESLAAFLTAAQP